MIKSDLVAKMIEKFKAAEKEIEVLNEKEDYEASLKLIDCTLRDLFKLSLNSFNSLSDENIMDMIMFKGTLDSDRCIMISMLLCYEGHICELKNDLNYSIYIYTKAFNMLLDAYLNNESPELKDYYSKLDGMQQKLGRYEFSIKTLTKLFCYYEAAGNYAKAEDTFYEMLDLNGSEEYVNVGLEFYQRLLKLSDEKLEKGNLPREEILDALENIKAGV